MSINLNLTSLGLNVILIIDRCFIQHIKVKYFFVSQYRLIKINSKDQIKQLLRK